MQGRRGSNGVSTIAVTSAGLGSKGHEACRVMHRNWTCTVHLNRRMLTIRNAMLIHNLSKSHGVVHFAHSVRIKRDHNRSALVDHPGPRINQSTRSHNRLGFGAVACPT